MTLATTISSPIGIDHPTIVLPPNSDGPFHGWGTRIG